MNGEREAVEEKKVTKKVKQDSSVLNLAGIFKDDVRDMSDTRKHLRESYRKNKV